MANINIDGKEYDVDQLSDKSKEQIASLQFVQNEMKKLTAQIAVYKTAAAAYTAALKNEVGD